MSKIGRYLQEHLMGEVIGSVDARRYFSTDGSIFRVPPALIVYPQNENDVRKTARFTWQLAERNRIIPMTARGSGTDQSGGALGSGLILAFPAHMNRLFEFDGKSGQVTVEPGMNYGKLQQALMTHGRFLPPFPASLEYSTIGGAVANNASGEKTVKYGDTRAFVRRLRVVLANGEVIETGRISKRELNKKMGLSTFEGELYRALDTLFEENSKLVAGSELQVGKNTAGYALAQVKRGDGSFDLTPLFVGSQGTLGIITEITLDTEIHNPATTLIMAGFDDMKHAQSAIMELRKLSDQPSSIEMVDGGLLALIEKTNPSLLKGLIEKPFPRIVLLVENDSGDRAQRKSVRQINKILDKYAISRQVETDIEPQAKLWKIRHMSAAIAARHVGNARALPIIEDGVVPLDRFGEYLEAVYEILKKNHVEAVVWGHAGDANVHLQPYLDLSQVGDRQKAFKMMDEYYKLVIGLGGSTSGEHNDGRLRAPYLKQLYGEELYGLLAKVKQIFDPYGTLNPGVKIGVTKDDIRAQVRNEYSLGHLSDHLPRS